MPKGRGQPRRCGWSAPTLPDVAAVPDFGVPTLHPALSPLGFLVGTWVGEGGGEYSTIEPFTYGEELRIGHIGRPFLTYAQRTWSPEAGRPMHSETGFLRIGPENHLELVLAHPTGVVELAEGTLDGTTLDLRSRLVGCSTTAKNVTSLRRRFVVDEDTLRYELAMAAVGRDEEDHLSATLHRQPAEP